MRDQILDSFSHRDFSILVVGNKYDTISEMQANSQVTLSNHIEFKCNCSPSFVFSDKQTTIIQLIHDTPFSAKE